MPAESLKAEDGHKGHISRGFLGAAVPAKCTEPTESALHRAALSGLTCTACILWPVFLGSGDNLIHMPCVTESHCRQTGKISNKQ